MKSTTCKGSNGQFLEEYHSLSAAEIAIDNLRTGRIVREGRDPHLQYAPMPCSRCGYWLITPVNKKKKSMFCTDSALFLKDIYSTREEAQKTADWMKKEKKVQLYPYKCPHGSGWHLTKGKK